MRLRLLAVLLGVVLCQQHEIKTKNERPKVAGHAGKGKTRLLFLEYSYRGESVMYESVENKGSTPSTVIYAKYTWETLHHDPESSILSRLKMQKCLAGPCGKVPDLYVDFIQGGNNLNAVYMDLKDYPDYKPEWNWLLGVLSIVYTPAINGAGDTQIVDSVYGRCRFDFGRPEDKKFRRQIGGCEMEGRRNHTKYQGIDVTKFTQDVWYTQNTKVDADIVIIDAVEQFDIKSQVDERWGFTVESRAHIEMENRTRRFIDRFCEVEETVDHCAINTFKLTKVGDKMFEQIKTGIPPVGGKLVEKVAEYREHLAPMGETHTCDKHSSMFAAILREATLATEEELVAVIREPENEHVLPALSQMLGSLGTKVSIKVARDVLLHDAPELIDDFLFGVTQSITLDDKWEAALLKWLSGEKKSDELYWKLANALSTVLAKKCASSPSISNACVKGKYKVVSTFISDVTSCGADAKCLTNAFRVLVNLPVPQSFTTARSFLCDGSSSSLQKAALRVIRATPSKFYDSQLTGLLIRIFRDTCPTHSDTDLAKLAVDVLMESVLEQQHVATLLLRSESLNPQDPERWNYFYSAVRSHSEKDELKAALWHRMRSFKVFRPNYIHRALGASSGAFHAPLSDILLENSVVDTSSVYNGGIHKSSDIDISMKYKKRTHNLFHIEVETSGLDALVSESDQEKTSKTAEEPHAHIRIGFLGHQLPLVDIFTGTSQMMSTVWNADGQTIKAFEGNSVLRLFEGSIPLISGASIDFSSVASINGRLTGSCGVSVWNRMANADIKMNISASLQSSATLVNHSTCLRSIYSSYTVVTTVSGGSELDFMEVPPHFCTTVSTQDSEFRFALGIEEHEKKTPVQWQRYFKRRPGVTLSLEKNLRDKCNALENLH